MPDDGECNSEHPDWNPETGTCNPPDDGECNSEHPDWNPETQTCVPDDGECNSEHPDWNPETQTCVPDDGECNSEHPDWNPETQTCVPDDGECNSEHPDWDPDTKTCPPPPDDWCNEDHPYWNPDTKTCPPPNWCNELHPDWNPKTHTCKDPCPPPSEWNPKEEKCEIDVDVDRFVTTNYRTNIDDCPKSFVVAVDTLRLPGCLVSSANGIGTINFLERNFNNIIVSNNMLPNVLLSFTPAELRTTSSGQNVMTQLTQIALKDGVNSRGIDQIQFAFKVDWNPEPDISSNTFTYCKGDGCETKRYSTTF